jgi:hypothetical protein
LRVIGKAKPTADECGSGIAVIVWKRRHRAGSETKISPLINTDDTDPRQSPTSHVTTNSSIRFKKGPDRAFLD